MSTTGPLNHAYMQTTLNAGRDRDIDFSIKVDYIQINSI
jgi:hypothetical protein